MATKNWCYGAKAPDIEQRVSDAIFAAHRYRNRLCELELERRARRYDILRKLAPEFVQCELAVSAAEQELAAVRESIQAERVKQRTKTPAGVSHLTERTKELKASLKDLRAELKEAKLAAYAESAVSEAMDQNDSQHLAECQFAKEQSGLYWGTAAVVKMACKSFGKGSPPRFKRFEGEGQLAVQLQGGLDCEHIFRQNTRCYITNVAGKRADCLIRIGSEGGKSIFARVPIVFHRRLPGGKIKWAYLERRKIADHIRWTVRLTIDCERTVDCCLPGEVAIHTGWWMEPGGLRVATWLASDGRWGTLRLEKLHCDAYYKLDGIRSQRDESFNSVIDLLRGWLKEDRDLPDWLAEVKPHLHAWKANARLSKLVWQWSRDRFTGDDEMFEKLWEWRRSDKHLWQHERRLAVRIVRRRRDIFRNFAAMLYGRYGVAIVSPIDAAELTENSEPEDLERDNTQAHRHAKWAAVSELTQMIREKFSLHCVAVPSKNITRQCSGCGSINKVRHRKLQCSNCGKTIDIDENATVNILSRGMAALKSGAVLKLVEEEEDKVRKQQKKLAKMQEANRVARKAKKAAAKNVG